VRFIPRTLLVRTFLLISGVILATLGIWTTLFSLAEQEPRARHLAELTASAVNVTHAALIAAAPEKRRYLLLELSEREGIHLQPAEPEDGVIPLPDDAFHALFRRELELRLGRDTRLARAINGEEGLWASFALAGDADDVYWVMLPAERIDNAFPLHWLGWGAASLVLTLAAAWWIVSRVTRPLRALGRAARQVGRGRHPDPVAVSGAEELKQLANAFNQMSEDLARSERERAEVLAGISHDLRTPLARLRLEAEMSVNDEAARTAIAGDIEQMDAIIGQFLDYARAAGDEAPAETEVGRLLGDVAARFSRTGVQLQLDLADCRPAQLRPLAVARAVGNLIENARKYGGGEITLAAREADGQLLIEVMDRGPGIPAEEIERLKRPFTRLESARTDVKGTGLGLAIVERIAKLHGGSLTLSARDGGGLTATLRLPLS
jgi:two-component system osmolarity sensor histidine kinase EnvZ